LNGRRFGVGRRSASKGRSRMISVLILYYSSYGHIEEMANAVATGVLEGVGRPIIKRVPELVPQEIAKREQFRLDQSAPLARIEEPANDEAIVLGVPTRFGRLPAQMAAFLSEVLGKSVGYHQISDTAFEAQMIGSGAGRGLTPSQRDAT